MHKSRFGGMIRICWLEIARVYPAKTYKKADVTERRLFALFVLRL